MAVSNQARFGSGAVIGRAQRGRGGKKPGLERYSKAVWTPTSVVSNQAQQKQASSFASQLQSTGPVRGQRAAQSQGAAGTAPLAGNSPQRTIKPQASVASAPAQKPLGAAKPAKQTTSKREDVTYRLHGNNDDEMRESAQRFSTIVRSRAKESGRRGAAYGAGGGALAGGAAGAAAGGRGAAIGAVGGAASGALFGNGVGRMRGAMRGVEDAKRQKLLIPIKRDPKTGAVVKAEARHFNPDDRRQRHMGEVIGATATGGAGAALWARRGFKADNARKLKNGVKITRGTAGKTFVAAGLLGTAERQRRSANDPRNTRRWN